MILPVIGRELRAATRQSFTYNLRVLGAVALLIAFAMFALPGNLGAGVGSELFCFLHAALFLAIWILVPLLTSDVLSRERREGTLPLLFLTPLRPRDMVHAKGLAQGLRAFTLWLAVIPVLTISFLVGGLNWQEVVFSALINFSSICLALGAGLLASACARVWARALALSLIFAVMFLGVFVSTAPSVVVLVSQIGTGLPQVNFEWIAPPDGFEFVMGLDGIWRRFLGGAGSGWANTLASAVRSIGGFAAVTAGSVIAFQLLVWLAAWRISRIWREEPASARVQRLQQKLCRPVMFRQTLGRWLKWQLQRNPIGWLEQRSWAGRLVVWSWFAVVVCIYSSLFANLYIYERGFHDLQNGLATMLAGSIALSAAGSFRRERETGVLELLLVAPLREWQIIGGRIRGLWMQFLPSVILLCGVWIYGATFLSEQAEMPSVVFYAVTFATVPVVGLYFSLVTTNFIVALIGTLVLQLAVPLALGRICSMFTASISTVSEQTSVLALVVSIMFQILSAVWFAWLLRDNLRKRRFALVAKGG